MKITEIKINPENPRFISDSNFQKLVESISRDPKFMKYRPIIVDENNIITGGNMRYRALVQLGYKEIPKGWVQQTNDLTEEERRRFIVMDNVEFGDFDWDMMSGEYTQEELKEWGVDMMFDPGDGDSSSPDGDRLSFHQVTFTFSGEQEKIISEAILEAQRDPMYDEAEKYGNESKKGNALYFIVSQWIAQRGKVIDKE